MAGARFLFPFRPHVPAPSPRPALRWPGRALPHSGVGPAQANDGGVEGFKITGRALPSGSVYVAMAIHTHLDVFVHLTEDTSLYILLCAH